jgi:transposase InsO family protein
VQAEMVNASETVTLQSRTCASAARFSEARLEGKIEHRLTKPNHPWTNGQVERVNRTLKEATVRRYYYETHDQLRSHLADFVMAYNDRRCKMLAAGSLTAEVTSSSAVISFNCGE